ncbi:glycosyltransferase [Fluviicola sp.]|uniref:glycosyltransferase n=1 Tax=Fluviicola sp. TaxID=1917219 RepID=UPI002839602B|nr:glycosyltransferase [Fluviicola sp.]MDR0801191.1 glycosyltransferase [Fluviicola sp.]
MPHSIPKIAVIIVNYNVVFFLEQCLNSVVKAMKQELAEVWVVDNNSVDGSVEMVREKFPWVRVIANKDNKGFSKANNQAMELSECKYQLLLNPDTVIEEDTLHKVVRYMDEHPDVGGLGVRMVDGKGIFLPESKRGLPTPAVAFYKIFGISRIFPKSKIFGKYHLGYLSEFETNEIEILSGAFMLMRKEALDKVGLLDEEFFMYGEDIDLSYRIIKGGYKNVYFPETRIIHYKGESTKKSSVNYVFVFYRAMVIFARKHFSQKNARLFSFLINSAIYFRAGLAIGMRFIRKITLPVFDMLYILMGLFALTNYWQQAQIDFPEQTTGILILLYTFIWMNSMALQGAYDQPVTFKKFISGGVTGTALILILYALFPKEWQFSRLFILLGAGWIVLYYIISRYILHLAIGKRFTINGRKHVNFAIVGSQEEFDRVSMLLYQTQPKIANIVSVSLDENHDKNSLGSISQLEQIVRVHNIDEIIFCARDTSARDIIHWMIAIPDMTVDYKIAQPDSQYLIGSNSIETAGDLYILEINAISQPAKQRQKRLFDIISGLILLLCSPLLIWFYKNKLRFLGNVFSLISGRKTLVSYSQQGTFSSKQLPKIKKGILTPTDHLSGLDEGLQSKLDLLYAREYSVFGDIRILWKAWKKLDQ